MMLCGSVQFNAMMKKFDVRKGDEVILYDTNNMIGAARAFWMFGVFGIQARVMNGLLSRW